MSVHVDLAENFHPYSCDGPGFCVHCDRLPVVWTGGEGTSHYSHDPATCELCDPSYDGLNNPYRDADNIKRNVAFDAAEARAVRAEARAGREAMSETPSPAELHKRTGGGDAYRVAMLEHGYVQPTSPRVRRLAKLPGKRAEPCGLIHASDWSEWRRYDNGVEVFEGRWCRKCAYTNAREIPLAGQEGKP